MPLQALQKSPNTSDVVLAEANILIKRYKSEFSRISASLRLDIDSHVLYVSSDYHKNCTLPKLCFSDAPYQMSYILFDDAKETIVVRENMKEAVVTMNEFVRWDLLSKKRIAIHVCFTSPIGFLHIRIERHEESKSQHGQC